MKYIEDYRLASDYIEGDRKAGEILFAKTYNILCRYINFQINNDSVLNSDDSDDIVNNVFMRVVEKMYLYNGSCKFSVFVIGIAKNIIREYRRGKGKQHSSVVNIENTDISECSTDFGEDPIYIIIKKEKKDAILKAFKSLPTEYQNIIALRIFNSMSFKKIVLLSGKSEEAVDSMFRRAIKKFKENIKEIYYKTTD